MRRLSIGVALVLSFLVVTQAFAQFKFDPKNLGVNGGLTFEIPVGSFSDVAGVGIGFIVQGEYQLTPTIGLLATIGYVNYSGKSFTSLFYEYRYNYSEIPLTLGAKYYLPVNMGNDFKVYAFGEAGFHRMGYSFETKDLTITPPLTVKSSFGSLKIGITPGAGAEFNLGSMRLDVTAFMAMVTGGHTHLGMRTAVHFNIAQ